MTEKSVPSKNEEQRHIEAGKMRAEAERALAVAKAKLAHAVIEEIEKRRKMSSIYSLHERIIAHMESTLCVFDSWERNFMTKGYYTKKIEGVREEIETYESIRFDFKEIMGLSDEKLKRLFPKINLYFETRKQAATVLGNMLTQERQMWAYSRRMRM